MRCLFTGVLLTLLTGPLAAQDENAAPAANDTVPDTAAERDGLEPAVDTTPDAATRSAQGRPVMDEIDLDRTEITGNQELPKVLYIVPWQKSDPGALMGKPVNTLLEEVLEPIDRGEFVRQVRYYNDLENAQE